MKKRVKFLTAGVSGIALLAAGLILAPADAEHAESSGVAQAASATAEAAASNERRAGAAAPQQARRTLVLPSKGREAVLEEMRLMLEALNGVIAATARGDRRSMAREARSGGTVIAVDTDPAIAKRLPEEFVSLGSATHHHFDSLAARIERGISRDSVLSELGSLTNKCVACHSGYRVVTPAMEESGQ